MQALSLFISCLALGLMILGLVQRQWVKLEGTESETEVYTSPWMTFNRSDWTTVSAKDRKIWHLMTTSIILSIVLSFTLGFDYTSLIPQFKGRYFIFAFISFLTGTCLLTAVMLFYQGLKKYINIYYLDIKVTWIFYSTYVTIFLYLICGILCILSHRKSHKTSLELSEESPTQSPLRQPDDIQQKTDNSQSSSETLVKRSSSHSVKSETCRVKWAV